jgi:aminopeptidase
MVRGKKTGIGFMIPAVIMSALILSGCAKAPPKAAVDYEALAEKLVNQCAQIKEGDIVWVNGGVKDFELLEDIAVHVRKAGAFPLVTAGSDRMDRRMVADVPEKWDTQRPVLGEKMFGMINAVISADYREKMDLFADIPPQRLTVWNQNSSQLAQLFERRRIRSVYLGNGLYPTAERAKLYNIPLETLSKLFWDGMNVDYTVLKANCEAVKKTFAAGREIRITHGNGTDLTFGIKGRMIFSSDGIIPPDDPKKKAQPAVWLPAGEVIITPVPGTAKGKVVVEKQFYQGKEINGMSLVFEGGKVVSIGGGTGGEKLLERYQLAGTGKEMLGYVDIGTNPNVRIPAGSSMTADMPSGAISMDIGGNTYVGGENSINFGIDFHLNGYTLAVDGKVLVENGVLKI